MCVVEMITAEFLYSPYWLWVERGMEVLDCRSQERKGWDSALSIRSKPDALEMKSAISCFAWEKTLHQIQEVAVFLKVHSEGGEHRFKLGSFQGVLWRARRPPFFPK